jgi:hypothetical protein
MSTAVWYACAGVVRQDKHRRLAIAHELARHAVHEVGPDTVRVVQVLLYGFHRHLGLPRAEFLRPHIAAQIVHHVRTLGPVANRLAQYPSDDAVRRPLHQLEGELTADAVAEEEELADAEMVHQPQVVVSERIPLVIDRDRPVDSPPNVPAVLGRVPGGATF